MKKKLKRKKPIKLKGIVHYCCMCKKKTEHRAEGEHWINYAERCKICGRVSYSEILRKDYDGKS
jgi:hypothetical protein